MQDQVENLPGSNALASFCEKGDSAKEFTKELRSILEVTAATGRYWHDWAQLRVLLCFRLTQVLQEFHKLQHSDGGSPIIGPPPESEPFPDMMERLVQNLDCFTDGAPFTSQRLCEILLSPKDTYNNLDKLALAFEKLLLVQSTYPPSTNPYPLQSLPGAVPTERPGEDQNTDKLEGDAASGAQDSIGNFKDMPPIDEEMVDVERDLDAQVAVDMVASSQSDMLREQSVGEIPQPPDVETTQAPITASEMLLETTGSSNVEAAATNTEMLHDSTGADLPQVPGTNFEMLQDSPIVELPQAAGTNSEMLHDFTGLQLYKPADSNTEMVHDSTVIELPPTPVPEVVASNTEMLDDANVVDLLSAPEENRQHRSEAT